MALSDPLGSAINYQGRLNDGENPADGMYSFRFRLLSDAAGAKPVGQTVELPNQTIADGLLSATLDFGAGAFNRDARWLEISVKPGGPGASGEYTRLTPQPLLPAGASQFASVAGDVLNSVITGPKLAPLAITTAHISDAAITAPKIAGGQVVRALNVKGATLRDNITLAEGQNISFAQNGNTVTIASSGGGGPWASRNGNAYFNGGNIGIGTSAPGFPLHVHSAASANSVLGALMEPNLGSGNFNQIYLGSSATENGCATFTYTRSTAGRGLTKLSLGLYARSYMLNLDGAGRVGIGAGSDFGMDGAETESALGTFRIENHGPVNRPTPPPRFIVTRSGNVGVGTANPTESLHVRGRFLRVEGGAGEAAYLGGDGLGNDIQVGSLNPAVQNIYMYNAGNNKLMHTHVGVLTIHGGADLAEPFPVNEGGIEKGSVMVIDDEHPGRLKRSTLAYDTRVAGILSGAHGINPGIALKQEGVLDQGENVALSGRVYARADASYGAIKPGDLLTTSGTAGHAMKVADSSRAQGAILGKAMTPLPEGRGLVLVLVTLQ